MSLRTASSYYPLTPTLGFGILRRPTSSIHGVVPPRGRGGVGIRAMVRGTEKTVVPAQAGIQLSISVPMCLAKRRPRAGGDPVVGYDELANRIIVLPPHPNPRLWHLASPYLLHLTHMARPAPGRHYAFPPSMEVRCGECKRIAGAILAMESSTPQGGTEIPPKGERGCRDQGHGPRDRENRRPRAGGDPVVGYDELANRIIVLPPHPPPHRGRGDL